MSSTTDSDSDDSTSLPFPQALPRADFLTPNFSPPTYLSTLSSRHQTLEDLRTDLRSRSSLISSEMHDLVNANWAAFLSLGLGLRGGEEKVECVRVATLGFKRAVEEVGDGVKERREKVAGLKGDLEEVMRMREVGRQMLGLGDGVALLEGRLGEDGEEEYDEHVEGEGGEERDGHDHVGEPRWIGVCPTRLKPLAVDLTRLEGVADDIGRDVPFVKAMGGRMGKCRRSLLLDLGTGLKEARQAGGVGRNRVVDYLGIYSIMGAEEEAVEKLRER